MGSLQSCRYQGGDHGDYVGGRGPVVGTQAEVGGVDDVLALVAAKRKVSQRSPTHQDDNE